MLASLSDEEKKQLYAALTEDLLPEPKASTASKASKASEASNASEASTASKESQPITAIKNSQETVRKTGSLLKEKLQLIKASKKLQGRPYVSALDLRKAYRLTGPLFSTKIIKDLFEDPLIAEHELPSDYPTFRNVVRQIQCTCGYFACKNKECDWKQPTCMKYMRAGEAARAAVDHAAKVSIGLKSSTGFDSATSVGPALENLLRMVSLFREMNQHLETYEHQWAVKGKTFGVVFDLTLKGMQAEAAALHDFFLADAQSLYHALKNLHDTAREGFTVQGFQALQERYRDSHPELEAFDAKTPVIPKYGRRFTSELMRAHQNFEKILIRTQVCGDGSRNGDSLSSTPASKDSMIRDLTAIHQLEEAVAKQWCLDCLSEPGWNFEMAQHRLEKLIAQAQELQDHQKAENPEETQEAKDSERLADLWVSLDPFQELQDHQKAQNPEETQEAKDSEPLAELWTSLDPFQGLKS